ncbi:MAG: glycoside hydrolase [Bacteroidetes bacterium GWD2_45_23]|nr:MAG: glycoside hydrolase [Bacteroidetes bacterium GWC2_46_850]OFX86688.1 MAG: glycoside hydrolase [Bacteroidetes bacterium GWD2_45_23]HBB01957.1 glycoside hydrolase [Porphyromonadaceae bacterium]HCC19528.1 glycoside hydrolase [Porphyromonadaceae bacterium]
MRLKNLYAFGLIFYLVSAEVQGLNNEQSEVDYPLIVSSADLVYKTPVSTSEEGLPIGNGVMGTLQWTTPTSIRYQLNRTDVFGNNAESNNFYERHTDYCGGIGFIDIDFPNYNDLFSGNEFMQHLSCYTATIATKGKHVNTETFVWSDEDVMVMNVAYDESSPVVVHLRSLRPLITKTGDHSATSSLKNGEENTILLLQTFKEENFVCKTAVAVKIVGVPSKSRFANETDITLTTIPENGNDFQVYVASVASFNEDADVEKEAIQKLQRATGLGYDAVLSHHQQWWKSFWEKSFVKLHSSDGVADKIMENYTYFLYVMGSSSRGAYEPKFNGMLWTTGGDARKWGNLFWGANQSCYYNGLFPTNRPELMRPLFDMYTRMYASLERAAVQQWDSKGIFIPETVGFDGLPELSDEIAQEMQDLYLLRKPWEERSDQFGEFAKTKMPFNSRWNWKQDEGWKDGNWHFSDKGGGPFGHVTHIFSRGAKIAYQYWLYYEYTQDKRWLRERAYPMLKGVAEFYRNFPHLKKENDGKYHIRHVNDNESVWDGHNTVEEIASMMGILPVAMRAAEILDVDIDLREQWNETLVNLSPLPLSSAHPELSGKPVTFVRSLLPVLKGPASRIPDPNTMPVWFFDLYTLESANQEMMQIAQNTFDAYFPTGINKDSPVYVLSKLPVTGAQLGRADATRYLIPNQIETGETEILRNRMDLREGFQTTGVQRLGRAADALHNALCQSIPASPGKNPVIHLFPAWPKEWDAHFSLLARGNFIVTSSIDQGKIEFIEIKSNSGSECNLRNPWENGKVTIYKNKRKILETTDRLISIPTKPQDVLYFVNK